MTSYGAIEDQRGREAPQSLPLVHTEPVELKRTKSSSNQAQQSESKSNAAAYLIYAIINVIIAVPGYEEISVLVSRVVGSRSRVRP